jgi:4-hydroxyacetophenone monooxygenase
MPGKIIEQAKAACADESRLRQALDGADIVPLMMSLVHLTGDARWLDEAAPYINGGWSFLASLPDDLQRRTRGKLVDTLNALATGRTQPAQICDELLTRMMHSSVGVAVPVEYNVVFREEAGFDPLDYRSVPWRKPDAARQLQDFHVLIIGAGFSGIGMAIALDQAGIRYTIVEKNNDVGGTWLENQYPGCGVDTPCHFYSYSFAPNPEWSSFFAKRDEILKYVFDCVERFGVRKSIRFGEEVIDARYDEANSLWQVRTRASDGTERELSANILVPCVGALNRPAIPNIKGLGDFKGPAFHTAQWRSDVELKGKRVAMVGTGASIARSTEGARGSRQDVPRCAGARS